MATIPSKPTREWASTLDPKVREAYEKQGGTYANTTWDNSYKPNGSSGSAVSGGSSSSSSGGGGGSSSNSSSKYSYSPYKAPSYNPISYSQATSRAQQQIDPIYTRALENVRASIQPAKMDADQTAAARGGLHSGLAADLQNKVQINANNKMADLQSEQSSKIAALAQAIVNQDFSQQQSIQQNAFQNWLAAQNFDFGVYQNQQNNDYRTSEFEFNKKLQEALTTGRWYY